ncbi:MAG: YggS family pyridoxal phosphate-dependent enzyme [Candidatus Riflebacteria bacterium]|nr:YggS family pyridoxal phosphate-dependent enzyme [Candidatus Riflebacteria bacterium]
MELAANLRQVRERIAEAARRAGRDPAGIRLVAVSKTVEADVIRALVAAGHTLCGESRPQVLRDKARLLADTPVRWHFIGPLQSNKIKYVYPVAELVHSIDRPDLLDAFAEWARRTGRRCPCLLEVHISDEATKQGFDPQEVLGVIERIRDNPDLDVQGLMGMAPFVPEEAPVRAAFRRLAGLFEASRALEGRGYRARELSMGMTDDFPLAVEEGATIVRIGRAVFGDHP